MDLKTFQKLMAITSVGFFVLALMFDVVISYTVYSTRPGYFLALEVSDNFKEMMLTESVPLMLIAQSSLGFSPILFYCLAIKFNRDFLSHFLIVSVVTTIIMGTMHINGGLSWWA